MDYLLNVIRDHLVSYSKAKCQLLFFVPKMSTCYTLIGEQSGPIFL